MKQQNKQQKKKVHSIRGQFAWIFIGLMIGTILLCLLLNYMFLGRVYMQSKLDVIHDAYETIKQAAESDSYGSEEFAHELDDVCRSYNMTVCVMDVNSNMKYVSINGGERLENRLIGYVFGFGTFPDNERIIENGDDYVIQRTGQENKEYLEIYGRLNTGISFYHADTALQYSGECQDRQSVLYDDRLPGSTGGWYYYLVCLQTCDEADPGAERYLTADGTAGF